MLRLLKGHLALVVLIGRDEFLVVEVLLALEIGLRLLQVDLSQAYTHFCTRELAHIGNHLYLGDDVASIDIVARHLVELGDDTRDLRLDVDLVARFDLTCDDGGLLDTVEFRGELVVDHFLGLALLPQEHEGSDENQRDNRCDDQF